MHVIFGSWDYWGCLARLGGNNSWVGYKRIFMYYNNCGHILVVFTIFFSLSGASRSHRASRAKRRSGECKATSTFNTVCSLHHRSHVTVATHWAVTSYLACGIHGYQATGLWAVVIIGCLVFLLWSTIEQCNSPVETLLHSLRSSFLLSLLLFLWFSYLSSTLSYCFHFLFLYPLSFFFHCNEYTMSNCFLDWF